MPTIQENELENTYPDCIACGQFAGDIYLCGVGMICTSCFSTESGCNEADLFNEDEIPQEYRDKARASLYHRVEGEE